MLSLAPQCDQPDAAWPTVTVVGRRIWIILSRHVRECACGTRLQYKLSRALRTDWFSQGSGMHLKACVARCLPDSPPPRSKKAVCPAATERGSVSSFFCMGT